MPTVAAKDIDIDAYYKPKEFETHHPQTIPFVPKDLNLIEPLQKVCAIWNDVRGDMPLHY